jgi:hypothetical protein
VPRALPATRPLGGVATVDSAPRLFAVLQLRVSAAWPWCCRPIKTTTACVCEIAELDGPARPAGRRCWTGVPLGMVRVRAAVAVGGAAEGLCLGDGAGGCVPGGTVVVPGWWFGT